MFYFDKVLGARVLKSDKITGARHFFTTRELILKTKENVEEALLNREKLKKEFSLKFLHTPSQRHTSNIVVADKNRDEYENTDALILNESGAGIFLNFADCTPVILYDKNKNIAAIAHAGWRGTVQKIGAKTVLEMEKLFNCEVKDITALIGPCICEKCFETSLEIAQKLALTVGEGEKFVKFVNDKAYADLKKINSAQLYEIGVKDVDIAPYCTYCNNDTFFSYRKENKTTNRMSACICL